MKPAMMLACRSLLLLSLVATALLSGSPGLARDVYVAPPGAELAVGDGTADAPFRTVWAALNNDRITGGDRVLLLPGTYGELVLQTPDFDPPIRILPSESGRVHLRALRIDKGSGLTFEGLAIWPVVAGDLPRALVRTSASTARIRLHRLDLRGAVHAPASYRSWVFDDWKRHWAPNGVMLGGADSGIFDSRLVATNFGLTLEGDRTVAEGNHILGFSGDAIRVLGDGSRVEDNEIRDCVKINDNHDDGIQSWANRVIDGQRQPVRDVVIARNTILEWTGSIHNPLRCVLQGIGFFDGFFDNLRIENNIVSVSSYHGISVYGGRGVSIVNNTVVHASGTVGATHPWILLHDKKDGTPARDIRAANNIAAGLIAKTALARPFADKRHNMVLRNPARLFPRMIDGEFRHAAQQNPLIDNAISAFAPMRDRYGVSRPQGQAADIGAVEWK